MAPVSLIEPDMGGRAAVGAAVAVWLGLLWGAGAGFAAAVVALAIASLGALVAWRAPDRLGTLALIAALGFAAAARGAGHALVLAAERRAIAPVTGTFWVEARLCEPPLRAGGEAVAVTRVLAANPPLVRGTRLRVRLPAGCEAEWGDRVGVLARLDVPALRRNPGGYDARRAADASALAAAGRALVAMPAPAAGLQAWPRATCMRWRRALERVYRARLDAPTRELVVPLVLGDRSALPTELDADFRASGLVHLLALSGLHVMWLAALARGLVAAAGGGTRARAAAGALSAGCYVGIAGPLPPLARAAATEALVALARWTGRALDPVQALGVGALLLLGLCPGWACDLGFQLSCAATLGLVTVGRRLQTLAGRWRVAASLFIPTASAQLAALPLLLARFHALPWTAGLSNLIAVPITGLLLVAAWLGSAFELMLPGGGRPWFGACEVLAGTLRAVAERAGGWAGALVPTGGEAGLVALATAGVLLLVYGLEPAGDLESAQRPVSPRREAALLVGSLWTALALLLAITAPPLRPGPGRAWVVVLDVGQGDAIALGTPDGWRLVDSGAHTPRFDAGDGVVLPFFRWAGVRRLEALVLTHDDGDHIGGAPAVRRGMRVARLLAPPPRPGATGPGPRFGAESVARGDTLARDPPLVVRWPPRARRGETAGAGPAGSTADNRASLVLELGAGAGRALLLADADSTVEDSVEVEPGIALLKVAHHGSASSSGARFLARAAARVAVISVGRHNAFGHPDPRALARLTAACAEVRRTDEDGALWFELSREGVRAIDWRAGAPGTGEPGERFGGSGRGPSAPRDAGSERSVATAPQLAGPAPRW